VSEAALSAPIFVDKFLRGKRNGFFVEAGAFDGEYLSNTIFLEVRRNWTGLLVEPNGLAFRSLMAKRRNVFAANVCLSDEKYPEEVDFDSADVYGAIIKQEIDANYTNDDEGNSEEVEKIEANIQALNSLKDELPEHMRSVERVQCLPLYSILMALGKGKNDPLKPNFMPFSGNPAVDYLSLDLEGSDLAVLRTLPLSEMDVKLISAETSHVNERELMLYMGAQGYEAVARMQQDVLFQRRANEKY